MSDCCNYFEFTDPGDSFQSWMGLRGPAGPAGAPGPIGPTPNISIGTVTTGAAGSQAEATMTGTPERPALNLVIPRGDPGEVTQAEFDELSDEVSQQKSVIATKAGRLVDTMSGAVASFIPDATIENALTALSVAVEPQQDLHGYDSPWPAGGGVNKFDGQIEQGALDPSTGEKTPNVERYRSTNFIGVKPSTRYRISVNGTATSANIYSYDANKTFLSNVERPYTNDFTTGADTYFIMFFGTNALNSDKVQIEEGSSVTAWTPYSNICPISGRTSATVTRTGKNLANDAEFSIEEPSWSTTEYWLGLSKNADGTFTLTRPIGWGGNGFVYVGTYKAGTYKLSFDLISTADVNCGATCAIKKKGTWTAEGTVAAISGLTVAGRYSLNVFTITEDCDVWLAVGPYVDNGAQVISGNYQVELGSTASAYEPYQGNTYTITIGQTVYGGSDEVVSGNGTSTMAMVDLGTLTWAYNSTMKFFQAEISNVASVGYTEIPNAICSMYATGSIYTVRDGSMIGFALKQTDMVYIRDPAFTDTATFKTAMSGQQLVYTLATPTTFTHAPTQISTLEGQNNVWSDAGDVTVEVAADLKWYIDSKIAAAVAALS